MFRLLVRVFAVVSLICTAASLTGCSSATTAASAPAQPGVLAVAASTANVAQSAGAVTISVTRTGGSTGAVSVAYTTADGTAIAGTDYVKAAGTLTWAAGDSSTKTITVTLSSAPGFDGTRAFSLVLSSAAGGATLGVTTETVTITGSGAPGVLSMAVASLNTTQTSASVTVTITRTGGSTGAVAVSYMTQSVSAVQGVDFTPVTNGYATWASGDTTSRSITIGLVNGTPFGGTRDFLFEIFGPVGGATLGIQQTDIVITGRGSPGTISFSSAAIAVMQTAGSATLTFTRTGGSTGAVTANYTEVDGTALGGTDYTKTNGTATWADGDTANKTVNIPLSTTPYFTGTKTFQGDITGGGGGASYGTGLTTVTITGGYLPPASYFSFSGATYTWKEQLPIDQYGGTGGTNGIQYASIEESNAQINAGFVDPYFYADTATYGGATNHVIFTAPSNGAVTTPGVGSDHTRSELRELYNGTGADSNSDWNSAIGGTLTASCVVNSVSVTSDEATIGQIHNQSYVFALLMFRPGSNDIAFDLYSTLGGSTHTRTSMVTAKLGDTINYSINYKGNSIIVTVNGTTKTFAVDSSWAGTPMYFKLGAYHAAPNTGNPSGDQTQVAFSSFSVSH
jgi:hypothetical protein